MRLQRYRFAVHIHVSIRLISGVKITALNRGYKHYFCCYWESAKAKTYSVFEYHDYKSYLVI